MKVHLRETFCLLFVSLFSLAASAQENLTNKLGSMRLPGKYEIITNSLTRTDDVNEQMEKAFTCPEGSVYSSTWVNDGTGLIGNMCADEGRSDMPCVYYQSIEANLYKVNGIRFFGIFKYFDEKEYEWIFCDEKGAIDENGDMTEPVRFRISFHKMDENGLPSEAIYSKEFDIIGNNIGIQVGDESSGFGSIYSFDADLGEDVILETGFVGITAVNTGDFTSCWFNVFTTSSSKGFGVVGSFENTEWTPSFGQACICLKGTGEMSAKKAVKIERFLSPNVRSNGKYEKVGVEISNAGSEPVKDVELELWKDGELVCTDKINETINPISEENFNGRYKHLFSRQVDCSKSGENIITVKNRYAEDEGLCDAEKNLKVEVLEDGGAVGSGSSQMGFFFIKNVVAGDISNKTDSTSYSDFTDHKTTIYKNQNLDITVEMDRECNVAAWVDWNGNGLFGEAGEFVGYVENTMCDTMTIAVPDGIDIRAGEKRLRLVSVPFFDSPSWSGTYNYGETEDYTLVLATNPESPSVGFSNELIELSNEKPEYSLTVTNKNVPELLAKAVVSYVLPGSPDGMNATHSAEKTPESMKGVVRTSRIMHGVPQPVKDAKTEYVLGYDRNPYDCVSMLGEVAIFGQLYPARMLKSIEKMQIASIDAYIGDLPGKSSVVIYRENKNSDHIGDVIVEKEFVPEAHSWNRVVLDAPVEITGNEGLIVAVKMSGFKENEFYIGTDNGDAVVGYGDLSGFNGYWWSMADLQINSNFCIRANVTGKKTPAISWLDMDKKDFSIANGSDNANVKYNGTELDDYLYSAVIEFDTNDELRRNVRIPVYFINGSKTGVISAELDESSVTYDGSEVKIVSRKPVFNISVYDVAGNLVENVDPEAGETAISTKNYDNGIYIISIMYADGNRQGVKIPVNN